MALEDGAPPTTAIPVNREGSEAAAAPGSGVGGLAAAAGERRAITREILSLFVAFEAVCGDFCREKKKLHISALRAGSPRKPASLKGVPE